MGEANCGVGLSMGFTVRVYSGAQGPEKPYGSELQLRKTVTAQRGCLAMFCEHPPGYFRGQSTIFLILTSVAP